MMNIALLTFCVNMHRLVMNNKIRIGIYFNLIKSQHWTRVYKIY